MSEVTYKMVGNKLVIEVDITALDVQKATLSKTGKSRIVTNVPPTHVATVSGKPISFTLNILTSR